MMLVRSPVDEVHGAGYAGVMLRFLCDEPSSGGRLTRREWLRIGGLAGLGAATTARADSPSPHQPGFGRARSVLVVFTGGGMSQLDTLDPKSDAPAEIRGEFRSIATAASGIRVCEHLPRVAQLANRFALVRSMSHDDFDHGSASYL